MLPLLNSLSPRARALCAALLCLVAITGSGQSLTLTLAPSNHNGYNISCFGRKDGSVDLTVTGGTPPYTYNWSSGSTTQDVSSLAAGFYAVTVTDAAGSSRAEITLTEPVELRAEMTPFEYGSGYNISLFNAYNGSINLMVEGSVPPYTYEWRDGPTTEDRTALGSDNYDVAITDANGCMLRTDPIYLRQPERSDWTNTGNAGTTPGTNYIGTSDNKDVVFKSNGAERLRLLSGGDVKVSSLVATGNKLVYADENGVLKRANWGQDLQMTEIPWFLGGNNYVTNTTNRIGPIDDIDFLFITGNIERARITQDGKVGIGTVPPSGAIDGYRLYVEDGIATRDVLLQHGSWPDDVFSQDYRLIPLAELRAFIHTWSHLPGIPSAAEVAAKGGAEVGDIQRRLLRTVEEQTLYILQLEEKLERVEQRLQSLETSKH